MKMLKLKFLTAALATDYECVSLCDQDFRECISRHPNDKPTCVRIRLACVRGHANTEV